MLDQVRDTSDERTQRVARAYPSIRKQTTALCEPLEIEDYGPQSMPEASPTKWHLAHTTWFFERFVLQSQVREYRCFHPQFERLFNSYYDSVGPQQPRHARGLLSRPTVSEIYRYRDYVDGMQRLLERVTERDSGQLSAAACATIEVGLHHEQQHQELLLTDLKHLLFANPMHPAYRRVSPEQERRGESANASAPTLGWHPYPSGQHEIGAAAAVAFCFDNETPRHRCYTQEYALADRPVSCGEFRDFIRDGGYQRSGLWLSDGWQQVQSQCWGRPLYWSEDLEGQFTLAGDAPLVARAPVCHVSYYEADAFARWAGARLPTEAEWERAAAAAPVRGNLLESGALQPQGAPECASGAPRQLFGDVWEWTGSAYLPYPGFRPWPDALGEYNSKFMANQLVLRGGSCVTPRTHIRPTYRNFFYPQSRWQFSGIRLAQDS